jgi:oxygen-independent coproporphyrinogen-3 oxidase
MDIMCCRPVCRARIRADFALKNFDAKFATELEELGPMLEDGLVVDDGDSIEVTERGRPFVRNIAMCFDAYLRAPARGTSRRTFSRVI